MAIYSVDCGGAERDVLMPSLRYSRVVNGVGTLSVDFDSEDASYRPQIDDELYLKKNGTAIWGGIITDAPEESHGGPALDAIVTRVGASSFDIYATFRVVTVVIPTGTVKAALTVLVAYLSSHGVTLHASQVDGPTLPELNFTRVRLDGILNQITTLTDYAYLWRITATKELEMYQPSAAPFNILDSGTAHQVGDVIVERTVNEKYANRVILTISGAGPKTSQETFTAADGVSSGGFTRFTSKYPADVNGYHGIWPNSLRFDGVPQFVIGWAPVTPTWPWTWDPTTHQLVYDESSGAPFPTGAEVIDIEYDIGYPFDITADNLAEQAPPRGIRERLLTVDQAMSMVTAQAYADAFVANSAREIVKAKYATWDDGLEAGMSQTITQAKRNIDDAFVLLEVNASYEPESDGSFLRYDVTAVEGANVESDWRQLLRDWLGGKSSSGGVSSVSGTASPAGNPLHIAILRLSDAEIKAAADTPQLVVAAPGSGSPSSGQRIKVIAASLRVKTEDGAYTNIAADAALHLVCNGKRMSTGWYNDSAVPVTRFDELFGQVHALDKVGDLPIPAMDAIQGPLASPLDEQLYVMGEDIASMADIDDVDDQGLFLLLDNGGAGAFTGGGSTNGLKLIVYYVIEDIAADWAVAAASSCSSTLWSDDFESGAALSADYTDLGGGITKTAGIGAGGSQGADSNGTFLAEFCKTFAPSTRNGCISFDISASAALHAGDGGGFGSYLIEVHDPTGPNGLTAFGLSSGGAQEAGTDFGDIFVYNSGFTNIGGADEALTDGVYATVRIEFETSSMVGATPQADAWIKVYVDDVLLINLSGLTISTYHAVNNPNNYWGGVRFAPQGAGDNLLVRN